MAGPTLEDVRAMYAKYPYPSPVVGNDLIYDVAILLECLAPKSWLSGKKVLDAGCGSGHRLSGSAKRFPKAQFMGIDMTPESLAVAKSIVEKRGIPNVRFAEQNLAKLTLDEKFDLIVSTGVIHHLEDPKKGLTDLSKLLTDDGVMIIWHYHSFGEYGRLLDRELVRLMWEDHNDYERGVAVMGELGIKLDTRQYGVSASQSHDANQVSIDVDAYLHPIVVAYRFDEGLAMFGGANVDWIAINGFNTPQESKMIDLDAVGGELAELCFDERRWLKTDALVRQFRTLRPIDRLRVIELLTRPTGFVVMAGRGKSLELLGPRMKGNVIPLESLST